MMAKHMLHIKAAQVHEVALTLPTQPLPGKLDGKVETVVILQKVGG